MFHAADAGVTLAHDAEYASFGSEFQPDAAQREDLELVQRLFASVPNMQLIFQGNTFEMRADIYPPSLVSSHRLWLSGL